MKYELLTKKLEITREKFIVSDELREICRILDIEYNSGINYLANRKYVVRILRGIFYIKSLKERKNNTVDMGYYKIIAEALRLKGVKKWYFGLETALKLNKLTHEYFTTEFVMSDTIFRARPMKILGKKIKFVKLKPTLFSFGLIKKPIPYSNVEKTVLDMLYLRRYGSARILPSEYIDECSDKKLLQYAKSYSKALVKEVNERRPK